MATKEYFIVENQSKKGPFSFEELKSLQINRETLVWREGMKEWFNADQLDELAALFIKSPNIEPPPIPEKKGNIKNEIEKETPVYKKEGKSKKAIRAAKEIKAIFLLLKVAFVIGILSLPVYYFVIYRVNKYSDINEYNLYLKVIIRGNTMTRIDAGDFPFPIYVDYDNVLYSIERRKKFYQEKSIRSALITFLITMGGFIAFRYISKGTRWVSENSKGEV